ncbi:antigen 5 like allergen Cul n 1-like [Episyrphus balteatus]|uniref:antigen 5 like allergen Cul n 1-like n=1 Tax=Episyrphus balteatus TaxID=286459 RepID=UPI002486A05F|nr:antigen 5 like allergen Cul n 1-like [Episyrphus balteatus]
MISVKLLVVLIGFVGFVAAVNYCDKALCGNAKHISCNATGKFSDICKKTAKLATFTADDKKAIVKGHNALRNDLASGKITGYDTCPRMATMQWDDELALSAGDNVKRCLFAHDECHNTFKYKSSGQNICELASDQPHTDTQQNMVKSCLQTWWTEKKDASMTDIKKYPEFPKHMIGHYTVMAVQGNDRVGCAASYFNDPAMDDWFAFLFTCNYAKTNIINGTIYTSGKTASGCKAGVNPSFKGLCSEKEVY